MNQTAIIGSILGTAVGDAIGLPYEGLSPARGVRLLGPPNRYHFLFRRGMISDDTEHTCMVAQSLIDAAGDVDVFAYRFASRLRWWILALPSGVGKATALSGIKLWLGARPATASVFSAGNGPAMRAAIIGAAIDDISTILQFVRVSTRLTHSDPKAEYGAIAVALAAWHSRSPQPVDAKAWLDNVDTSAAIVGGIVGAGVGHAGIPNDWLERIWEWPRSVSWMQRVGTTLAESLDAKEAVKPPTINPLAVVLRNMLFLIVVLFHGFRRLFPPY